MGKRVEAIIKVCHQSEAATMPLVFLCNKKDRPSDWMNGKEDWIRTGTPRRACSRRSLAQ
jgi:hypothetical protein